MEQIWVDVIDWEVRGFHGSIVAAKRPSGGLTVSDAR